MIPLQDVMPSRSTPWVALALIGLIALGFAWEWTVTTPEFRGLDHAYANSTMAGRWMFAPLLLLLHTGLLHAGSNMLALWIFGDTLEDRIGHARFAALCLVGASLSAAAVISGRHDTRLPTVGSAGIVAAVIAGYLTQWPRSRVLVFVPLPLLVDLVEIPAAIVPGFWLLLQLLSARRGAEPPEAGPVLLAVGAGAAVGVLLGPLFAHGRGDRWKDADP